MRYPVLMGLISAVVIVSAYWALVIPEIRAGRETRARIAGCDAEGGTAQLDAHGVRRVPGACTEGAITRALSMLTAIALLGSAAAADDLDRAFRPVNCERPSAGDLDPKQREPGVLSFEKMGLCRNDPLVAESPFGPLAPSCAACGMNPTEDPKTKVWRPYRLP
jgi:hypothetical protein